MNRPLHPILRSEALRDASFNQEVAVRETFPFSWTDLDGQVEEMKREISDLRKKLDSIIKSRNSFNKLTVNGDLEVEGENSFRKAFVDTINGQKVEETFNDIVR